MKDGLDFLRDLFNGKKTNGRRWLCGLRSKLQGGRCHIKTDRQWMRQRKTYKNLGGGFKYFFIFIPTWGRFPFWLINIFQMGWFNHQTYKNLRKFIQAGHLLSDSCRRRRQVTQGRRLGSLLFLRCLNDVELLGLKIRAWNPLQPTIYKWLFQLDDF